MIDREKFVETVLAGRSEDIRACALARLSEAPEFDLFQTGARLGLNEAECRGVMDGWDELSWGHRTFERRSGEDGYHAGYLAGQAAFNACLAAGKARKRGG